MRAEQGKHPNTLRNLKKGRGAAIRRGTMANLARPEIERSRIAQLEAVSVQVAAMLRETGASKLQVTRQIGSIVNTLDRVLGGNDFKLGTIARIAAVCGRRLVVRFESVNSLDVDAKHNL